MRRKGSAQELLARRRRAISLFEQREFSLSVIARLVGCSPSSVVRWRDRWLADGERGLAVGASPGRPQKMSKRQKAQLLRDLLKGPMAFGWQTDVWTTKRIAALIQDRFSVSYHYTHVARLLHALDWSPQKPERRALERNEQAIQEWKAGEWKRIKKTPRGWAPT